MISKKSSLLIILKVLEKYSDENHYLKQQDIIDLIKRDYNLTLERKCISSSIKTLMEDFNYDICSTPKKGTALIGRAFDKSQVQFLVDAIFSSRSLPGNRAKELAAIACSFLSENEKKDYTYINKSVEVNRTLNKDVLLNVELLTDAIRKGKWITFCYLDYDENGKEVYRHNGSKYLLSPCYLINNFGRYYLMAYDEGSNMVKSFRIDRIKELKEVENYKEIVNPKKLNEFKNYKSISEYINDHIYLFPGNPIEIELQLKSPSVINYINDWFGKNAKIYKFEGELRAKIKSNKKAFIYWAMQYGEHIKIISPNNVIDEVKKIARNILNNY